jgi:hypothetical protein
MKALPHIVDAGSSADGTVWGMFQGGILVLVIPYGPPNDAPVRADVREPDRRAPEHDLSRPPRARAVGTVPKSNRFRLFNGLGSFFAVHDPRPELQAMLTQAGYSGTVEDATLANLRTVSGDGIFYLRTHGGRFHRETPPNPPANFQADVYALWTSTEVLEPSAEEQNAQLVLDLLDNRIVYMTFRNDMWSQLPLVGSEFAQARHYGITGRFVSEYISLGEDSLAYIDACESATDLAMAQAFQKKNASLYVGWDERAWMSAIAQTSKYVFDRLLGANRFAPEDPHQRPFPWDALARDPKFGTGKTYGYSTGPNSAGVVVSASLGFYPLGTGHLAMLAPSLYAMQVNEGDDELVLFGMFGPDAFNEAKVLIDDGSGEQPLTIKSATGDGTTIRAQLPRSGARSSGNVRVTLRGHASNTRQLLAWDGALNYVLRDIGSLTQRFALDIRLREDPQDVRDDPGVAPHPTTFKVGTTNLDTAAHFEVAGSGSRSGGGCTDTFTWSGSGDIQATKVAGLQRSYFYTGSIDLPQSAAWITGTAIDASAGTVSIAHACPEGTQTFTTPLAPTAMLLAFQSRSAPGVNLSLDDSLSIAADSRQASVPSGYGVGNAVITLQWPTIAPRPPYDATLPR